MKLNNTRTIIAIAFLFLISASSVASTLTKIKRFATARKNKTNTKIDFSARTFIFELLIESTLPLAATAASSMKALMTVPDSTAKEWKEGTTPYKCNGAGLDSYYNTKLSESVNGRRVADEDEASLVAYNAAVCEAVKASDAQEAGIKAQIELLKKVDTNIQDFLKANPVPNSVSTYPNLRLFDTSYTLGLEAYLKDAATTDPQRKARVEEISTLNILMMKGYIEQMNDHARIDEMKGLDPSACDKTTEITAGFFKRAFAGLRCLKMFFGCTSTSSKLDMTFDFVYGVVKAMVGVFIGTTAFKASIIGARIAYYTIRTIAALAQKKGDDFSKYLGKTIGSAISMIIVLFPISTPTSDPKKIRRK